MHLAEADSQAETAAVNPMAASSPLSGRNATLLFRGGLVATAALCAYFAFVFPIDDPVHRFQGLAILILSVLPGLRWARRQESAFPVFQTFMITGLNSFALPLLGGHELLRHYPAESVTAAAWGVILFQLCAIAGYELARGLPRAGIWWNMPLFKGSIDRLLRAGLGISTLYTLLSEFTEVIPPEFNSILRAIAFGVGTLCTFLLSRAWGAGELSMGNRIYFGVMLGAQALLLVSTLFLVSGLSLLVLALIGYVSGGKRIPIVTCLLLFVGMAILHNGKSAMRMKYWEDEAPRPTLTELPSFFAEWVQHGLTYRSQAAGDTIVSRKLIERTSLLHMLTLVVDATPSRQPFLDGETYAHVLPQLVPRIFWPDKPVGHVSTHRLATYYGLQDEESTLRTTIGFGVVAEAFANFGFPGLAMLGALIGVCTKLTGVWTRYSPLISYPGLLMVLLLAWSFQIELPMSAWIASLSQAAVAVLGVPFVLKRFIE
ncbi:MAG: hypothetical protein KBA71_06320 [Opitutaceae bacterium]|nr:hypothetical protein [Opitutaceae bacterium]